MTKVQPFAGGLALMSALGGYGGSPTRCGRAVAIVAVAAPHPTHLGTDSQAFIDRAEHVHALIRAHRRPARPFGAWHDGDLWQQYYNMVQAKGVATIKLSKVKGHATRAMVDDGTVAAADKHGNDFADTIADQAVDMHGKEAVLLGQRLAKRHKEYTAMLCELHAYIAEVYRLRGRLLEQQRQADDAAQGHHRHH